MTAYEKISCVLWCVQVLGLNGLGAWIWRAERRINRLEWATGQRPARATRGGEL